MVLDGAAPHLVTAAELEGWSSEDERVELVRGKVERMAAAGFEHALIAAAIFRALDRYVGEKRSGYVVSTEAGFVLARDPDTVRAPDVAFVTAERTAAQERPEGFFEGAPDLAVEVVSPTDAGEAIEAKVLDYLDAGTRQVWVVYPRRRTVRVVESRQVSRILGADDTLDGGDLLPGFAVRVGELFP